MPSIQRPASVPTLLSVRIVSAMPAAVSETTLQLPVDGTGAPPTVADALRLAGVAHEGELGIWGKRVSADTALADGDRIELYRPLIADPKLARRQRASDQGYRWQGRTRRAARAATLAGNAGEAADDPPASD